MTETLDIPRQESFHTHSRPGKAWIMTCGFLFYTLLILEGLIKYFLSFNLAISQGKFRQSAYTHCSASRQWQWQLPAQERIAAAGRNLLFRGCTS